MSLLDSWLKKECAFWLIKPKPLQRLLDARVLYPDSSLADLYDETSMPPELRKAHQNNDRAVVQAYGFSIKDMTESKCVAELLRMYQALTENK